jgi:hypothetical protein
MRVKSYFKKYVVVKEKIDLPYSKKINRRARKRFWEKSEIPFHFFQED